MRLTVTTPLTQVLDEDDIASIRAEDASGGFGILPGHADLLTVLRPSVLHWRRADGVWRHVALRGGVMQVAGDRVRIAAREAAVGDDLSVLETDVRAQADTATDTARTARAEQLRLQAGAIRVLMRRMGQEPGNDHDAIAEALE